MGQARAKYTKIELEDKNLKLLTYYNIIEFLIEEKKIPDVLKSLLNYEAKIDKGLVLHDIIIKNIDKFT